MNRNRAEEQRQADSRLARLWEILVVSGKLGLTSFGGPSAHLGYFYDEYIRRRGWLDERSYADLVALCQFLPGPASSQVGIGIGVLRAGLWGGIAAWLGFTLPSVLLMVLFAFFLQGSELVADGWLHGLKVVAVAVVAHAILGMGKTLAPDRCRATIAVLAAAAALLWQTALSQLVIILSAGLLGYFLLPKADRPASSEIAVGVPRSAAIICLGLFFLLLLALPVLRQLLSGPWAAVFDSFYRAGSLVFGGGHVVLPLLEREVVPTGWVSKEAFLAGYAAAQAVPGPLFTFAAYLGAVMGGWAGAVVATLAIFLPAFLLVIGSLPYWQALRRRSSLQGVLAGINAAVVGILLAALYDPLWTDTIQKPLDVALAAVLYLLLAIWRTPPWIVVAAGAAGGALMDLFIAG